VIDHNDSDEPDDDERGERALSKTAKKNELKNLRVLAQEIVELSAPHLAKLTLPDDVLAAVREARRLDAHAARRRQINRVGQLLDGIDVAALRAEMAAAHRGTPKPQAEATPPAVSAHDGLARELLDGGDDAVFSLTERFGREALQPLRQAVRAARKKLAAGASRETAIGLITAVLEKMRSPK
jgi:ribosome-associated protein